MYSRTYYSEAPIPRWIDVIVGTALRVLSTVAVLTLGLCTIVAALEQNPVPIHVSSEDAEAHILERSYPPMPLEAQAARISGTVILEVVISPSGEIASAQIVSGQPLLTERALEAVRGWKYKPFTENGTPVQVTTEVAVSFKPGLPQRSWPYGLLFIAPYVLLAAAWVRRTTNKGPQSDWRSKVLLVGLLLLTVSLAELSAELLYRYIFGHKLGITPSVAMWASVNALLCLLAGFLSLLGKGPGRFVSFAAAPLLVFVWAIHVAF